MWIQEKESWHTSVTILLATLARGLSLPHSCWGHETLQLELMMAIWHPSIRSQCFWRIQRKGWLGSHGGDGDGLEMHPISRLGGLFWSSIDCVSSQEILLFQNISVLIFCRHGTCIGKLFPIIDSLHYWTDYLLLSLWILCIPVVKYVTSCVFFRDCLFGMHRQVLQKLVYASEATGRGDLDDWEDTYITRSGKNFRNKVCRRKSLKR